MKKIILSIFAMLTFSVMFGQTDYVSKSIGTDKNNAVSSGAVQGKDGVIAGPFADTTAANLRPIKLHNGALIVTLNPFALWIRNYPARLWVQQSVQLDGIISGGIVTQRDTTSFNVSAAVYYINGIKHISRDTIINLNNATVTPRFDIFAVNTSNQTVKVTGTPGTPPVPPPLSTGTQLQLNFAYVRSDSIAIQGPGDIPDLLKVCIAGNTTTTNINAASFVGSVDALIHGITVGTGSNPGNTALGNSVLPLDAGPGANTGVGNNALHANTTGQHNTGVGSTSLVSNTTGQYNTAIGSASLNANQTGSRNTGLGWAAMFQAVNPSFNTMVGWYAGRKASGNFNTGVGYQVFGAQSIDPNITGDHNSLFGADATLLGPTVSNAVGLGYGAHPDNNQCAWGPGVQAFYIPGMTTGVSFVLKDVLGNGVFTPQAETGGGSPPITDYWKTGGNSGMTTSDFLGTTTDVPMFFRVNNVPFGVWQNKAAFATNMGMGYHALQGLDLNGANSGNIAYGPNCLQGVVTGSSNVAIGSHSLFSLTSGSSNTALGNALNNLTTGIQNIGIGNNCLGALTTGNNNIAIGGSNQFNILTTGSHNVGIGMGVRVATAASKWTIALGDSAQLTANNQFAISDSINKLKFKGLKKVIGAVLTDSTGNGDFVAQVPTILYSGSFSQAVTATTSFTVTIGATMANTTYKVVPVATSALAAAPFYIANKTTTTFDVVYLSGLTGTVTFEWVLYP